MNGLGFLFELNRIAVGDDLAVLEVYDPGCVLFRKFGVMGDHDDQAVLGDFLEQIHDLHAGFGVKRTGRLIRQQDIGVVHQGSGDGDSLHLTAGHLVGFFVELLAEPYLFQGGDRLLPPLGRRNAGDRKGEFDIGKHRLMGNQIVALKHKSDRMVAVGIPVPVLVLFGGDAVDDEITAVIPVKTPDNV